MTTRRPTLIVGHAGQDGTLLRKSLAGKDVSVVGVGRSSIEIYSKAGELVDSRRPALSIEDLLDEFNPSSIYYLAANHISAEGSPTASLSKSSRDFFLTGNVEPYMDLLDSVHRVSPEVRVFFASSSQVYSEPSGQMINEESPFLPKTLYGVAKAQSVWLGRMYRDELGLFVSSGILFNHESHLRPNRFLSSRVIEGAWRVASGESDRLEVGSLSARVDWSLAEDFVEGFQLVMELERPDDFIFSSGRSHSVEEFVNLVFSEFNLDWSKYVVENPRLLGKAPGQIGSASNEKLLKATGWQPQSDLKLIIRKLVDDWMKHRSYRTPNSQVRDTRGTTS